MKRLVIVIPTHNRRYLLFSLLGQIFNVDHSLFELVVIVVVDGSTDGTIEMLKKEFPQVHIVYGNGNWWYTKSMNEGFKYAEKLNPDFVLTLNDDINIQKNYIAQLASAIEKTPVNTIIGSVSVTNSQPYKVIFSGIKQIIWWRMKLVRYHPMFSDIPVNTFTGIHESLVLPGRGTLIPYHVLKDVNYFDEKFVQYHSDFDFSLRARKKGYLSVISWDALIFSYPEKTNSSSSFINTPFIKFAKSFFNKYSRLFIFDNVRYIARHGIKFLFPVTFIVFILASFKAHFLNYKIK